MKIPRLSLVALAAVALAAAPAAAQYVFSNPNPITMLTSSAAPAVPYPSTIWVAGVPASFNRVTVTISRIVHQRPGDLDVLLVGPQGQTVLLLSDAGDSLTCFDPQPVTLVIDDGAPLASPDCLASGTIAPTNYGGGDTFPYPAPAEPYGAALSGFVGTDPTGPWRLFVVDDQGSRVGSIEHGWSLTFHAPAPITYQGRLKNGGALVNGSADLAFTLWSDQTGGTQVGPTVDRPATAVQGGLFTVLLDFGSSAITTPGRWLEITVNGVALSPRQPLSAAPLAFSTLTAHTATIASTAYSAQTAQTAASAATAQTALTAQSVPWSGITGMPADFADGVDNTGVDSQWANIASGIGYTGPGGSSFNGLRLTHGAQGGIWDMVVGGSANSFPGSFAVAEAGSAKMVVQATTGNVGIGTTGPTFKLDVAGNIRCTSLTQTSSGRYKRDVAPVSGVLERFLRLRPVSFTWDQQHGGDHAVGLIAEEVGELFPECVSVVNGVAEGIDYAKLTALAVQAIKEQQQLAAAETDGLRARLDRLERLLADRELQVDTAPQK